MTGDRGISAAEYGGHDVGMKRGTGLADGVDARVRAVQPSPSDAPRDGGIVEAAAGKLREVDAPLLPAASSACAHRGVAEFHSRAG